MYAPYNPLKNMILLVMALLLSTYQCAVIATHETVVLQENPPKKEVWLTIFVHGIISIKPHITVSNFIRFLNDNVKDSIYYHTVKLMRDDSFFFQNQAIQERGLKKIDVENVGPGQAASFMGYLFDYMNNHVYTKNAPINHYYTFGWSGLLSRSARYCDAKIFYLELQKEINKFRGQGIEPKIRILGYSHGGKIILELASVLDKESVDQTVHIDETLFLGMPIECNDIYLINKPIFKKVYNIFSGGDRVQPLDFFSCGQFFSDRAFKRRKDAEVADKVVQVEIKVIRKKGEGHIPLSYARCTDPLLYDGTRCSRSIRNVSPGHTELWFFGWTPLHYRKTFPLYPFPIVAFTPYILNIINSVKERFCSQHAIKIVLDPRRCVMLLENRFCTREIFKAQFLKIEELLELQNKARAYVPLNFTQETYNEHIEKAYTEAEYRASHKKSFAKETVTLQDKLTIF